MDAVPRSGGRVTAAARVEIRLMELESGRLPRARAA